MALTAMLPPLGVNILVDQRPSYRLGVIVQGNRTAGHLEHLIYL